MTTRTAHPPRPARDPRSRAPRRGKPRSIIDQRRTPSGLITAVAGVAAFAALVATMVAAIARKASSASAAGETLPAAVTGAATRERAPQRVADTPGIPGVLAWDTGGWPGDGSTPAGSVQHDHVAGPVTYTELPPVGGPHNGTWLNAGVYDKPVPSERAVHDLEHGAVWITYDPDLSAADVRLLREFVSKQTKPAEQTQAGTAYSRCLLMSPWATAALPSSIIVSSWGHQLRPSSAADPRLQRFVDTFRDSATYTPEHGEAVDGVPTAIGGRPLNS